MARTPVKFYLQNETAGYVGDSPQWWKKGGGGYTIDILDAQQFTAEECAVIKRGSKGTHRWKRWPVSKVLESTMLVANIELLRKSCPKVSKHVSKK